MKSLLYDRVVRDWTIQIVTVIGVIALLTFIAINAYINLRAQGVSFGYDFLWRPTRWDLSVTFITQDSDDPYWLTFLIGIVNTLILALVVVPIATMFGLVVAVCRLSENPTLRSFARIYVDLFRNLPLPFQLFFWYAAATHLPSPRNAITIGRIGFLTNRGLTLPALTQSGGLWLAIATFAVGIITMILVSRWRLGTTSSTGSRVLLAILLIIGMPVCSVVIGGMPQLVIPKLNGFRFDGGVTLASEFTALLVAIVFFGGACIAECIRGGVESVSRGQIDAACAIGLTKKQIFWLVVFPQALPNIVPPVGNQYLFLVRATTLGVAVGYADLFMVASTSINQTGQTIEILVLMASIFLVINYLMTIAINRLNHSVSFNDRPRD